MIDEPNQFEIDTNDDKIWDDFDPDAPSPGPGPVTKTCASGGVSCDFFDACLGPRAYTVDGVFDQTWRDCITPAVGKYTYAYMDYSPDRASPSGGWLYILNDWFLRTEALPSSDCYNRFVMSTGGGAERWVMKVYGDHTVYVEKNGIVVQARGEASAQVTGAAGFGTSTHDDFMHTIYELRFPALPGAFHVQLHDPGPSSACETDEDLVTEPNEPVKILQSTFPD